MEWNGMEWNGMEWNVGALFYVAFYKRDLARLRELLTGLLVTKQVSRCRVNRERTRRHHYVTKQVSKSIEKQTQNRDVTKQVSRCRVDRETNTAPSRRHQSGVRADRQTNAPSNERSVIDS